MKKKFTEIIRFIKVIGSFIPLSLSIARTCVKRALLKLRGTRIQHAHLQEFIDKKRGSKCNLNTLTDILSNPKHAKIQVSNLVQTQKTYTTKNQLLANLPELNDKTEILAIPIAISSFSLFRHFVTVIVDLRAGVVEFYDSLGFTTSHYNNTPLWGPKCSNSAPLTLQDFLTSVHQKYGIERLVENTKKHQTDWNQCALFVYDRIYKRGIMGLSFEQASNQALSSLQAFV